VKLKGSVVVLPLAKRRGRCGEALAARPIELDPHG
jgi:hypothetical protein